MRKTLGLVIGQLALTLVPAFAASEIVAPLANLSPTGIVIPPNADIRIYSPPMVVYGVFHDGLTKNAYLLSNDAARKKLISTDSAGNAQTYTDSDVLAGTSYRGGVVYGDQVVVTTDYYPGGGVNFSGLYTVNKDGTYSQWAGAADHGGAGFVINGVRSSLFLPASVPTGVAMPQGMSAKALRSNYTFGAVGNIFFKPDGSLFAFTASPNRKMLARIDANGISSTVTESDLLVGNNLRAGAPYGDGYVVAIDYAPAAGNQLSGIHTLNSDGTHTEWTLTQGHSGISDLIPAPSGGYYFTDFETDNIWQITTPGKAETAVLTNPPVALMAVAADSSGKLAAVNWVPGEWWSNGGVNAVYRVTGNAVVQAAMAPAGSQLFAIAASKGGIFGSAFYVSDTTGGNIFRLESDNKLTPVISGLTRPGRLKFDPITGNLAVVCDDQYIFWFGENLTAFQAPSEAATTLKGLFFSDFENDNIWFARSASSNAIPILDSGVPPGLGALTYNDLDNTIYALNWQGGWPFGGEDSIYAIQPNGVAKQTLKGSFSAIAMSKGGIFGQALHLSDSAAGKIVRLESNGTLTDVVSGLTTPGPISFDPLTGTLVVLCDGGTQIVWIGSGLSAAATGEPGTVGKYFAPTEQEFIQSGHNTINDTRVEMDLLGTAPGYYHAVSKRTLTGDFEITASIAMSAKSLTSGQNRSAVVQVLSDVPGQRSRQIAYAGILQKTIGYASTGGQYHAYTDMMINGGWGRFNNRALPVGTSSGTFKIKRIAGVITTHYLDGSTWTQLGVSGQGFSDRVRVDFQLDTSWDASAGVAHSAVFTEVNNQIASQSITFGTAPALAVGANATFSATSSSGLTITFTSTTPGICTVTGSTVTGLAQGTCTVTANQAGNASFAPAAQVTLSFTTVTSTTATDADKVFSWAERSLSQVFSPAGQPSQTLPGYRYRAYTGGHFLAVNDSGTAHLYYLGSLSNNTVLDLGLLSGWVIQAGL
jgi:hypothetical protein